MNDEHDTITKVVDYTKFQVSDEELHKSEIDIEEYLRQEAQESVDKWLTGGSPVFWENP